MTSLPCCESKAEALCPLQVFLTAYLELVMLGALSQGQSVLIHAGASGVGQLPFFMTHADLMRNYLIRLEVAQTVHRLKALTVPSNSCMVAAACCMLSYEQGPCLLEPMRGGEG